MRVGVGLLGKEEKLEGGRGGEREVESECDHRAL